jgi:hypothetical protein
VSLDLSRYIGIEHGIRRLALGNWSQSQSAFADSYPLGGVQSGSMRALPEVVNRMLTKALLIKLRCELANSQTGGYIAHGGTNLEISRPFLSHRLWVFVADLVAADPGPRWPEDVEGCGPPSGCHQCWNAGTSTGLLHSTSEVDRQLAGGPLDSI